MFHSIFFENPLCLACAILLKAIGRRDRPMSGFRLEKAGNYKLIMT
jgi:hypothetical protein